MSPEPVDVLAPWRVLSDDVAFETPWFTIRDQQLRTSGGVDARYFVHDTHDSVMSVCVTPDRTVLLERQYRPAIGRVSVDYPAGRMEADDASAEAAIRRELREETGYEATTITKLGVLDKDPGFSRTRLHLFLVEGVVAGAAAPDDNERILAAFEPAARVLDMIATGELSCSFCVSATFLAFRHLGWL